MLSELLQTLLLVLATSTNMPGAADGCYHWDATTIPSSAGSPAIEMHNGKPSMRFSHALRTRVDLGQGPAEGLKLAGPFSIELELCMANLPPAKASLVSKWQTRAGGRSYELGITPFGWLFFTVSASGNWDRAAAQLLSTRRLQVGERYHVAAVFEPGHCMAIFVNGHLCGRMDDDVPAAVFDSGTPVWLGNRYGSPSQCGFDGWITDVTIWRIRRSDAAIRQEARRRGLKQLPELNEARLSFPVDLDLAMKSTRRWYAQLAPPGGPYGAYRLTPNAHPDLYASADIAWIRWMMNDLELTPEQRRQWIRFIQSQQNPRDGTYRHITSHCPAHAFCHATGALNMLGGAHRWPPRFLDRYRDIKYIPVWLARIDWKRQWGASHDIWGAGLPLVCTPSTTLAWRTAIFRWLDREVDPATGFWRRGQPARTPLESLGGAFHIWPLYAATNRPLPYPAKVVDHVLRLQRANGSFDGGFGYGNMDAVWVLQYLQDRVPGCRDAISAALDKNLHGLVRLYNVAPARFFADAHATEARIATFAILQAGLPKRFRGASVWRIPWHNRRLFEIKVAEPQDAD